MDSRIPNLAPQAAIYRECPDFSDRINRNIVQSEIDGGVWLRDLLPGTALSVQTLNRVYELLILHGGAALISGHPEFCPEPTETRIHGSTWGGAMIKTKFIGCGMLMEYGHPVLSVCRTSPIVDIRVRCGR